MPGEFNNAEMQALLAEVFAPWVQDLGLRPVALEADGARFVMPESARLSRGGGVVCGQAVAAAADTCSVLTLAGMNGRFRNCTTTGFSTQFLRPLAQGPVEISVTALTNGRRMAVTQAAFRNPGGKLGATATCSFAYLED